MKKYFALLLTLLFALFAMPAFAANPFAEVPKGHWAYDAVEQLAADGLVSGYQGGTFKGGQLATRYEIASVVARAAARADELHAGKKDLDLLKKLVLEFKDELDSLGVKVNNISKRVSTLEKNIGGWNISGTLLFEAVHDGNAGTDDSPARYTNNGQKNQFRKEQAYLYLSKQIDENTRFFGEYIHGADDTQNPNGGMGEMGEGGLWRRFYIEGKLPYDIGFTVGRFEVNFEEDYGLFNDDEPVFGHYYTDGFKFAKTWGSFTATAGIGRNQSYNAPGGVDTYDPNGEAVYNPYNVEAMYYMLNLHYQPNERFFGGLFGYWKHADNDYTTYIDAKGVTHNDPNESVQTYGAYAAYSIAPSMAIKGVYYKQKLKENYAGGCNDSPYAWKAILDIKQDLLKYTSLWIEYDEEQNNFWGAHDERFGIGGSACPTLLDNITSIRNGNKTKALFIRAEQQWNDKWSSLLRYGSADFGTDGYDKTTEFQVGVTYQYTPATAFTLFYDTVDYGDGTAQTDFKGSDHVINFRTTVNF